MVFGLCFGLYYWLLLFLGFGVLLLMVDVVNGSFVFGLRVNGAIYWAVKGLYSGKGLDLWVLCMSGRLSVPYGVYYNIEGFN
jgi:hypothetical protein